MNFSTRLFLIVSGLFCLSLAAVLPISAQRGTGSADDSFRPAVERRVVGLSSSDIAVYALTEQSDGKILVGGAFNALGGTAQNNIARLNADGSTDDGFNAGSGIDGFVRAIAVQPDGKILIGGSFASVNGIARNSLARLNADGSLDGAFNVGTGSDNVILSLAAQPDGKIVIGGFFSSFNGSSRGGIARLNADGTLDNTVTAQFNSSGRFVFAVALQADGKILVGGNFESVNGSPQNGIARLNADGSIDTGFNVGSGTNLRIYSFVLQPDGKILIAGDFTEYNGISRRSIARLNPNGALDTGFEAVNAGSTFNGGINSAALQPDGKIIVVGNFQNFGITRGRIARLNANGALDATFIPSGNFSSGFDDEVYAVRRLADGRILAGGFFATFIDAGGTMPRSRLARLNSDGALDGSFQTNAGKAGIVKTIAVQPDGKVIVGGTFDFINGVPRDNIARLHADGSVDVSFNVGAGFDGQGFTPVINAVAVQPDGKILAAGLFAFYNDQTTQRGIIRLNADGSRDTTFNLPSILNGTVNAILLQPNGRILIGGSISSYAGRESIVPLTASGATDSGFGGTGFNTGGNVVSLARQPDGKILIGGSFNTYNGQPAPTVIRISSNGTRDAAFTPSVGAPVAAIALQSDGKIIIGGTFTNVSGAPRNRLARLNSDGTPDASFNTGSGATGTNSAVNTVAVQPDGKIVIGGSFTLYNGTARNGLARVSADGSLDESFAIGAGIGNRFPDAVFATTLQTDGKVLVGGSFSSFNGTARPALARIFAPKNTAYDFDGDGKADVAVFRPETGTWYLQQSTAGFTGLAFGLSTDKIVPADYDGDGKTDIAVVRNGVWYLQRSQAGFTGIRFGDGNDIPVPADYDGDGRSEIAVFRPSNGYWYILNLTDNQLTATLFGISTDRPVPADYDGDGKADIAVNRSGSWYIQRSQLGFVGVGFGDGNDKLVPADYDGDGKSDIAVFRPSNGTWYLLQSTAGFSGLTFGVGTDIPAAADYDGDGKADVAVVRNGNWYLNRSTDGFTGIQFGTLTDLPVPNAFVR